MEVGYRKLCFDMNGSEHKRMEGNVPPTNLDLPPSYEEATSKNYQNQFSSQQQSLSHHLNPQTAPPPIRPTDLARPSPAPNLHRCDSQPYLLQLYSGTTRADTRVDLPTANNHHVPDHPSTCWLREPSCISKPSYQQKKSDFLPSSQPQHQLAELVDLLSIRHQSTASSTPQKN
ncbi:hypothetical protein Pcinc_025940 [Petrolisthes cinctipes]|uniref:Uncharacterized protein n=1 Tax=Petrolisthes cinctipes TaxID=88211 RepID=A0AAE1F9H7_PETCI|nr:hypothetical protein Pcinc_025940 [Petrolisthes cinctipes]